MKPRAFIYTIAATLNARGITATVVEEPGTIRLTVKLPIVGAITMALDRCDHCDPPNDRKIT